MFYLVEDKYGIAVIQADSAPEALELLKQYEGEDKFLSYRKTLDDVKPLATTQNGILAYKFNG